MGASALPITVEHAVFAGSLRWTHRDPFDRLLVAQAMLEDATLVTVDSAIAGLPSLRVLTW
jgi:PIN domain nuclease of toxin-antitoxin system